MQGRFNSLAPLKKKKYRKMKKFYVAPEMEEVLINIAHSLLAGSDEGVDDETTDPTPVITDPSDDDFNW